MSEEEARKMLVQRLRAAYMMPNAYKNSGAGVSGGRRGRRRKRVGGVLVDDFYGGAKRRKRRVGVRRAGVKKAGVRKRRAGVLIDSATYGMGMPGRRMRGMGGRTRMAGHKAAARHNPWITEVKKYMRQQGISYKEALMALGSRR
jgi:hypothetical protein